LQDEKIYRILRKPEGGYTIEWSWSHGDEWYWYDEAYTLWGARSKIRKSEKKFDDPFVVGVYNNRGEEIVEVNKRLNF